jgi:hypothetical protein
MPLRGGKACAASSNVCLLPRCLWKDEIAPQGAFLAAYLFDRMGEEHFRFIFAFQEEESAPKASMGSFQAGRVPNRPIQS